MKSFLHILYAALVVAWAQGCRAFSLSMVAKNPSRRTLLKTTASSVAAVIAASATQSIAPAYAAPSIYKLDSGIKYAITKDSDKGYPRQGDIVAVEYTGYLSNGVIFDATHSEGKSNALLFKLGSTAVIPGLNQMIMEMKVGQKVQAIIPPELAFGDKGICLENGECLVKPGSTLVYDILLKKSSIPPP
jgi:FKBP-type peptidyl-prolyl cis-trans isomerase